LTITTTSQAPIPHIIAPSSFIQDLPNFGSLFGFNNRLRTLEANLSEFMQTNQFAGAVSAIPGIVHRYMDHRMNEAVQVAVQLQSDKLHEEAQKENDESLKTIDENMQKIIKEQVKEQVFKILPRIEQIVNEQLEAEVLTRSSNSSKIILDTYGDTVTLKRRRDDDANRDEEPSAGPNRGPRDTEKERSLSQQALIRKLLPGALAGQHKGLNLDRRRQASLLMQRSLCRLPFRWKSPYIQSLTQVLKINHLYNPLSILNSFLNNRNHHLRIVIGIRL
nr:hypothetical protein [Tanacetum cinerariifolium]